MLFSHKTRVGVLRGGPSPEYDVSLKTGSAILANLPEEYEPLDIFISKEGVWHLGGLEKKPYDILKTVDVVVNAMHGAYGEDGTVQKMLENFNVPYTGSDSLASALGMNKLLSKDIFRQSGLKTPHHITIERPDEISKETIRKINEALPFPVILKPINSGSSLGISLVEKTSDIKEALEKSFEYSPKILVEEYINGQEATCGVIEGFRGKDFYTLLPVGVNSAGKTFFDYQTKYDELSQNFEPRYKVPSNLKETEKGEIEEAASLIHQALGLRHYSRSDFIVHPRRGLFVLEVNTLPELTHRSSFVKSLEAVGSNIKEFLSHLLSKTLGR